MSLLDVWVYPATAHVLVDTCAFDDRRAANIDGCYAKMLVLPHAGTVLAARGSVGFLQLMFMHVSAQPCSDFDQVCALMPAAYRTARAQLLEAAKLQQLEPGRIMLQEVVATGWSTLHGRIGTYAVFCDLEDPSRVDSLYSEDDWVTPLALDDPKPAKPPEIRDAIEIAKWQVERYQHLGAMGGRLVVATVTRKTITTQTHELVRRNKDEPEPVWVCQSTHVD